MAERASTSGRSAAGTSERYPPPSGPRGGTYTAAVAAARDDCIFCKIVAGALPAEVLDSDERTVAFMDVNPWTRGHALVIPKAHSADLYAADPEDVRATAAAAQRLALRMRDALAPAGINLLHSSGAAAWQTVFHFHVHVIPRYEGDALRPPAPPAPVPLDEIAAVAAALRGGA